MDAIQINLQDHGLTTWLSREFEARRDKAVSRVVQKITWNVREEMIAAEVHNMTLSGHFLPNATQYENAKVSGITTSSQVGILTRAHLMPLMSTDPGERTPFKSSTKYIAVPSKAMKHKESPSFIMDSGRGFIVTVNGKKCMFFRHGPGKNDITLCYILKPQVHYDKDFLGFDTIVNKNGDKFELMLSQALQGTLPRT